MKKTSREIKDCVGELLELGLVFAMRAKDAAVDFDSGEHGGVVVFTVDCETADELASALTFARKHDFSAQPESGSLFLS
jgi:hypothetical protein